MIVSLEAIFLSIMVMVSQNRQSQKDRLRAELDYQVNVKAQAEIMGIARQLERVELLLQSPLKVEARRWTGVEPEGREPVESD